MHAVAVAFCSWFLAAVASATKQPDWFVVNGRDADPHAWPHQGALKRSPGGSHACGCVFISPEWTMTAAHCVHGGAPGDYYVLFGTNTIDGTDGEPQSSDVTEIIQHPDWTNECNVAPGGEGDCYNHDIAMLRLASPISENGDIITSIVMDAGVDRQAHECMITGWGQLYGGGPLPDWLQEAPINIISLAECEQRLGGSWIYFNPAYQQCAYDNTGTNPDRPAGPCYGDSGGPVQCRADVSSQWELVGLANWMIGDCQSEYPSAWTHIANYRQWVCDTTGDQALCQ